MKQLYKRYYDTGLFFKQNNYLNKYKAKWIRVYNNKHPILETRVVFYTIFKRKIKKQPYCGELTYTGMFKKLIEGDWYFIPNLLESYKEEQHWKRLKKIIKIKFINLKVKKNLILIQVRLKKCFLLMKD